MEGFPFNRYLGDGVYASFDGFHIWLAANHHENKVIALEPMVFRALVQYRDYINKITKERIEEARKGSLHHPKCAAVALDDQERGPCTCGADKET